MMLGDRALESLRDWVGGPTTGDVIAGRYELRQRIGEGGMGVVYAADDRSSGRRVAIKVVRGGQDHDAARFEREVASLEQVSHPAIVKCLAHGVHEGARYLVMERLEGCSLAERLRLGRLSVRETLRLGERLAEALAAVHRAGIAHRDIKPSNVFLVASDASDRADGDGVGDRGSVGGACLLDFGIARPPGATTLTARGALVGTPGYMAPERVRGDEPSERDPASDVFSLGCVMFECLLGRAPFTAGTTYELLAKVLLEVAPLVREERPEAPLGLEALIEQMLAKDANERPTSVEIARACAELLAALPPSADDVRREITPGIAEGDVIGTKYRVERKLGEGGMGVVLAARHLELGTRVAIKVLRAGDTEEGRFLREAQATSRIESDHVARVLDVGRTSVEAGSRPFIVMEHLRGSDLARRLASRKRLPIHVAVAHVLDACDAVAEAHALGIVHRDLKPSNLFIVERRDGTELVKVLDFGISKLTRPLDGSGPSVALTATADSTVMGSIAYMSPEQLESSARADARSDIWSLGVVLFEIVTGSRPFDGESAVAVAARIAGSPARSIRELRPDAPEALDAVIAKCLAKDPEARFSDVGALVRALAPFAVEHGDRVEATAGARDASGSRDSPAPDRARGSSMRAAVFVGIGVAALGGVAIARMASSPTSRPTVPVPAPASSAPFEIAPSATVDVAPSASPASLTAPAGSMQPTAHPSSARPTAAIASSRPTAAVSAPRSTSTWSHPSPGPRSTGDVDLRDPALRGR